MVASGQKRPGETGGRKTEGRLILSRRRFLTSCALGALGAAAGGYAVSADTTSALELKRIEVPLPALDRAFDGYTIGFVTDMHLGYYVPTELVALSAERLRAERCDLIALGGDYIWHPDDEKIWEKRNTDLRGVPRTEIPQVVFDQIADLYAALQTPDGVVAVLGNHDMWIAPQVCLRSFAARGVVVLENRAIELRRGEARLDLAGVADLWTGFPRFPDLPPTGDQRARILLAHNPDYVAESLGRPDRPFDLALCGHTHGGQVRLPFGGVVFDNIADKRFVSGLVQVSTQTVYTSNGIGVVEIPIRVNCPPEVTVITLRALR